MRKILHTIDAINERAGAISSWFLLFLIAVILYEVIARYVFNSPTKWAWDVNAQLLALFTVMAGGYVLYHKGHIRSDLFYARWSARRRASIDLITSFLPLFFCAAAVITSVKQAVSSVALREHSITILSPPLYPLRIVVAIGALLFLLQVIAEMIQNLLVVTGKLDSGEKK